MNIVKTGFLMMAMTALFMVFGYAVGGEQGMILALVFAVISNGFMYWFSDSLVLRSYNAQEITRTQMPDVYDMVDRLSKNAGLPMPKVYLIPSAAPNAFATGRNPSHAAVALTQGLYDMLSPKEVEAVLAHEMAHVMHRDILIATIVGTLAGAIGCAGVHSPMGGDPRRRAQRRRRGRRRYHRCAGDVHPDALHRDVDSNGDQPKPRIPRGQDRRRTDGKPGIPGAVLWRKSPSATKSVRWPMPNRPRLTCLSPTPFPDDASPVGSVPTRPRKTASAN